MWSSDLYFLNSARAGIFLLLKSVCEGETLRVGVQPFNCSTVFQAIVQAGCVPVFIDINDDYTIDLHDLEAKKDMVDLLILTHTFGIPAEMDGIRSIMEGKLILEDCAHAYLASYKDRLCGTMGDAAVFSINYGKFPSIGQGGFVFINNQEIRSGFQKLFDDLPSPFLFSEIIQPFKNFIFSLAFKPRFYGLITRPVFKKADRKYDFIKKWNFKINKGYKTNLIVFYNNINRFLEINEIRKERSLRFLSEINQNHAKNEIDGRNHYLIPLQKMNRDVLYQKLIQHGYECGKHFSRSIEWAENHGYKKGTCPVAERIADEILVMPNVAWLTTKDISLITDLLNTV